MWSVIALILLALVVVLAVNNARKSTALNKCETDRGETQGLLKRTIEERDNLQAFLDTHGGKDVWDAEVILGSTQEKVERAEKEYSELKAEIDKAVIELEPLSDEIRLKDIGLDDLSSPAEKSVKLGIEVKSAQAAIKEATKEKKALSNGSMRISTGDVKTDRRLATNVEKLMLRQFNTEAKNILSKLTVANYSTSQSRLIRAAETASKLNVVSSVTIRNSYVNLWGQLLLLTVEFEKAKKLAKEIEREHKAELREQARVERELEAEKVRLQKEKQHYLNVIRTMESTGNDGEIQTLKEKLVEIDKSINDVDYRAANVRAGYVYVISNIGSFGEDMVKIGMTRRLNPIDCVRELSDASVPFNFDVHALFFSEDAVGVETELHHRFADERVNLVNLRREFFRVTPAQVKEELADISGNLLEFVDEPEAEQYRLSLQMKQNKQKNA